MKASGIKELRKARVRRVRLGALKLRSRPLDGKSGPPPFEATQQMRDTVFLLRSRGASYDAIANLIINSDTGKPIGKNTLRKHFKVELERGMAEAKIRVGKALMDSACGAPVRIEKDGKRLLIHEAVKPDLTAVKWWQGTRE